ncbi:hypothetical protein [Streptomyces viridochromogenes]|uniref:Uncharacterized protein n=1 Tax=Streptomyces viridochromogenes Tue57 TaxID=1160705 RepID=L8P6Y9_STRVR|nr:hypothetical protein [Streptomyces viridochromogenes]ELS51949.1 hypothetical protein STVIR_7021 [Streptomyces viridochromogenes Tue57]
MPARAQYSRRESDSDEPGLGRRPVTRWKKKTAPGDRDFTCLRLLRLAVALDRREWCEGYAPRLLDMRDGRTRHSLLPHEAEYLGRWTADIPDD